MRLPLLLFIRFTKQQRKWSLLLKATILVILRSEASKDLKWILHFAMPVQNDSGRHFSFTVVRIAYNESTAPVNEVDENFLEREHYGAYLPRLALPV